jgi:hypothetical protein
MADRGLEHRGIVWIEDRLHGKYLWMAAESIHCARNHGAAPDRAVLFRASRPGTKPAAGGNNNGGSPFGHRDPSGQGTAAGHSPYHAGVEKAECFHACEYLLQCTCKSPGFG